MTKTILKIDGMMCGMCEAHVNDAIGLQNTWYLQLTYGGIYGR